MTQIGPRIKVSDVIPQLLKREEPNELGTSHQNTILMEVICDGELQRPLSLKEPILPAILKWADWSEEERKNNHLLFGFHPMVEKLQRFDRVAWNIDLNLLANLCWSQCSFLLLPPSRISSSNRFSKFTIPARKRRASDSALLNFVKQDSLYLKI